PVAWANRNGGSSPGHSHTASSSPGSPMNFNSGVLSTSAFSHGRTGLPACPSLLYTQYMAGLLYVVATPIGNLEDITYRAVRVLGAADLIACEDTRQSRRLLDHYHIHKPTVSYHDHNEAERTEELLARLVNGAVIALISDAGMPLVSDPGYRLVRAAIEAGIAVQAVPGPSASLTALAGSGLPTDAFYFGGFL